MAPSPLALAHHPPCVQHMLTSLALSLALAMHPHPFETRYIKLPDTPAQRLALHGVRPARPSHKSVLFIHGASFPTMLAFGFEFGPGDSWIEYMARQGYLSCGLDFLGFGASSRPPAMSEPADNAAPVTPATQAAAEIALAVDDLRKQQGMREIHLVAHSWGTIPAATFAASHPQMLSSLTLFGPIVPDKKSDHAMHAAWWTITAEERLRQLRFEDVLPHGTYLLEHTVDTTWAPAFAATVPHVQGDSNDTLRIPSGPLADIQAVANGHYPYDAARITVPVFVVYGNYDTVVGDAGAAAFLAKFKDSRLKWRLRIDNGTHVMHLEKNRHSLYASVNAFIQTAEQPTP